MEYKYLTRKMVEFVPELKSAYDEEMEWLQEDLPHLIFGSVFNPCLEQLLRTGSDSDQLKRMCEFMELMAVSPDKKVVELLAVTVMESLVVERDIVEETKRRLGPASKGMYEDIERTSGYIK